MFLGPLIKTCGYTEKQGYIGHRSFWVLGYQSQSRAREQAMMTMTGPEMVQILTTLSNRVAELEERLTGLERETDERQGRLRAHFDRGNEDWHRLPQYWRENHGGLAGLGR